MDYHMIHEHNLNICHKCIKSFIGIETLKKHIEQDQCDADDLSDQSINDSEYKDILEELRNEPKNILGHICKHGAP